MNGFLNVLKPPGMTSAAVVGFVRRITGEKRVGHAGTLDPEAAGVLPVMIGQAARLFDYLVDKQKRYVAEAAFGAATDTQDAQGRVIATGENYPDLAAVRRAAAQLVGDILQTPPAFSALKQGGRPLYELARKGVEVEIPARPVRVDRIEVTDELPDHGFRLEVDCGRGTYIRTICHDLGRILGCPAHMRFLLRTQAGFCAIEEARTVETLADLAARGELAGALLPLDAPLRHLPAAAVKPPFLRLAANGTALAPHMIDGEFPADRPVRLYGSGQFLGLAERQGALLRWRVHF